MALVSVSVYDSVGRKTILQILGLYVKELYNNLASRPNSEDLAGHSVDEISVDEIRVGSCKDSLDIVGDSSK